MLRDGCESDFALLELTLRDKLARIYNASLPTVHYVTSANSGMYEAHARHLTRKVFDVARRLSQLALFFDEPGGYSSSISFHIHNALDELEPLFIAIDQFDSTLFIGNSDETGDRSLAHNLALFFTYRLWREKPIELDFTNIANGQRLFRLHFDEMRSAMQEYRCEMHDFPMQWTPSRIEELEGDLSLTRDAIRALTGQFPPDWMLRDRFYALVTDDHHDPSPGEGPLVPIFFHNLEVLSAVRDLSGGIFEIPGGTGSDFHRLTDESPDHSLPDYSDDDQDQGHYYVDPDEQYLRAHGAYEIYRYNQELYRLRDHFLQLGALSSDEFVAEALTLIDHAFRGLVDGDYLHALAEAYEEILVIAGTRYIQDFENLLWGLEILVDLDDLPAEQSWTPFRSDVRHARAEVFSYSSLHFTLHGRLLRELIPRVRAIWETIRNQEMDNQAWRDLVVDLRAEEERRVRARQ